MKNAKRAHNVPHAYQKVRRYYSRARVKKSAGDCAYFYGARLKSAFYAENGIMYATLLRYTLKYRK